MHEHYGGYTPIYTPLEKNKHYFNTQQKYFVEKIYSGHFKRLVFFSNGVN